MAGGRGRGSGSGRVGKTTGKNQSQSQSQNARRGKGIREGSDENVRRARGGRMWRYLSDLDGDDDDDDEEEEWKRYLGRRVQRNVIRCLPSNYSYFSEVPSETAKEEAKKEEERTEPTEATSTSSPTAEKEIPPPLQRNLKFRRVPLPPNDDAAADADEDLLADYARFVQSLGGGATNAKRARFRFPLNWGTHVPPLPGRDDPGVLISHAGAAEEEEEEAENGTEDEESEDAVVVPPERRSGYVLRVPYVFGTVVGASPPGGASDGGNCEADEFKFEFEFEFEFEFVRFAIPAVARPAGRRRPHDRPEDVRHAKDVAAPTFRRHDDRVFALFVLRSVFRFFLFFFRRARVRNQNAGVVAPGEGRDVRPPIEREAKAGAFGVGGAAAEGLDEAGVVGEEVFVGVGGGVVVGREGDPSKFQISLQRRRNFFLCRGRGRRRRLGRLRPFLFFLCFFLRCLRRHLREIGIIGGKAADHVALDASSQIPLPLLLLVVVVVVAIEIGKVPPHAASSCAADVLVASLADPLATTGILTLALALVLAGGLADAAAAASSSSSSGHVGGFAYSMVW
mmetsp:Transcript_25556/g.51614  ORF Transcript_25556/g.51614 Transcript_25556/m.51614 type:complete len:567 (+) Transcript_25556:246-1946(+)